MFPYEDSEIMSVCPYPEIFLYPEKRNHPSFVNICSTLVIDTSMKKSLQVGSFYSMET